MMIIERTEEVKRITSLNKWIFLYGRRKTGKTFLATNFIKSDEYFFVKADKNILTKESHAISYETFLELLKRGLEKKETIIVDEFHRLGSDFLDFLHNMKKTGKLILISSTLFLSKKLISVKSAILGLFAEFPLGIIGLSDSLKALKKFNFSKKEWLELAILMREPIAIDYFQENKCARELIAEIIMGSIKTIPALVGEIFSEEEREMSGVYEGILRGIAIGKIGSGEISSYLFSKKLIKKDDPSIIQQYLNNLNSFGILKKLEIFNRKRFVYKLSSPLARFFYYADEKYNISERKINKKELLVIINELMPHIIEDNVREYFAEKFSLRESILEEKDFDIDACLLKFNKPEIAIEVKWKKLKRKDIIKSEQTLEKINSSRKILFVQDKKGISSSLQVLDIGDIAD
jgi:hypothetical protein